MSLSLLASTFTNNLLPIMLLSGAGFTLGKLLSIDSRSLGRVVFYVFSPLLVFNLLIQNSLKASEVALIMAFTTAVSLMMGLITLFFARVLNLERPVLMAVLITSMFGNNGNYGLPLVSFAFGEGALRYASLYFVMMSILFNTLGVLIASLGHMNLREAALGLLRVPTMYAVVLAALINILKIQISAPLTRTIELAAGGSIPLMLVLLGLELTRVQWSSSLRAIGLSTSLRLLAGPVLGLLLAIPFGLQGTARQGGITQTAMPAAVTTTVLATEYRLDPALVTAIVFVSTLLSPLTLTPLLVFLGR